MINNKYLSALILILLSSCDVIVDVDVPLEKPRITLNSVFVQDSIWKVQLMLNRHILDETDFKTIDDAQVIIFDEGRAIDTLSSQHNGVYTGDVRALPGRNYEVRASSPSYGSVYSKSYMPLPVLIDRVNIEQLEAPTPQGNGIKIACELTDRPGEANYYQLVAFGEHKYRDYYTGEERTSMYTIPLESNDVIIANAIARPNEGLFFKDELFEGKSISLKLKTHYLQQHDTLKLWFYLRTLSEDYYYYQITTHIQERTSGDPFAQPVSVYNNIENGFGIFGGASQSVFIFEE